MGLATISWIATATLHPVVHLLSKVTCQFNEKNNKLIKVMINYQFFSLILVSIFLFCSHGTLCAGTAAAVCNNTLCGCGIAYNAFIAGKKKICRKKLSTGPNTVRFCNFLNIISYSYCNHTWVIILLGKNISSCNFFVPYFIKIWIRL